MRDRKRIEEAIGSDRQIKLRIGWDAKMESTAQVAVCRFLHRDYRTPWELEI